MQHDDLLQIIFKHLIMAFLTRFMYALGQIFLLVDLREFFFRFSVGGWEKKQKSSENDQLTGHFQSFFFFSFSELFFF